MEWRLAGQAQTVILEFMVDGQPVVPDANTIGFTAWDNGGSIIQKYNFSQPVDAVPTQMSVVMSLALSDIPSNVLFESRYLRADFMYNSKPYSVSKAYRLHHMIPMTEGPQSVRALVGADHDELPDDDIDLIAAYMELAAIYGAAIDTALRRTDVIAMAANNAIALQAAVSLCQSMQSRLLKSEKADNSGFERAAMDFIKLEGDLRGQLAARLQQITDAIGGTVSVAVGHNLFSLSSQADRITGA
jgi:hypothetical protein